MPESIKPQDICNAARRGFERLHTYRKARAMFMKAYVGQYYQSKYGLSGDQPINLLFNAIRIMVPNLVMKEPEVAAYTPYEEQEFYGDLLALGTTEVFKQIKIKGPLRSWIVDSLFGFGIMKTSLRASGYSIQIDDVHIDPGQVYSELVDLDDFTFDPACNNPLFRDASFTGNSVIVPRQYLLDNDIYDHDLVQRLPSIDADVAKSEQASEISGAQQYGNEYATLRDLVRVVELHIPDADALVTIPDPRVLLTDKFISEEEYYGPKDGPYSYLSFTPPVSNNPFPVAPVGIWYDLHTMANRIFQKMMDQAERQKDITLYNPAEADTMDTIREARDGETVASNNPKDVNVVSYGGVNPANVDILGQLQTWFSYMAGNIEQLGGTRSAAATATQAEILQQNATVTLEDSKTIFYDAVGTVAEKTAWYLDTDPLIDLPLTKRTSGNEKIYMKLTPEQRQGDFRKFVWSIVPKSMAKLSPLMRSQRMIQFATNVLPAAVNAAMISMQSGTPFNLQRFCTGIAEELGLADWVGEVFQDPEFAQKMHTMMQMGPQNPGKATMESASVLQNKGFGGFSKTQTPQQEQNSMTQEPAGVSQVANNMGAY